MKRVRNVLLIGGTGRNTGKTTIVCNLIKQFSKAEICAIKITPHFHNLTEKLVLVEEKPGFIIYKETDSKGVKDTSRMLAAGAHDALLIQTKDEDYQEAFAKALTIAGNDRPIICESPSLRHIIEPDIFIMIKGDLNDPTCRKDAARLISMADIVIEDLKDLKGTFPNLKWSDEEGWRR